MRVWRMAKTRYAPSAFDGEGAKRFGGRWNSTGTRVAYASSNSALAVLEVLVHMTAGGALTGYSLIAATLPDALVDVLPADALPANWKASPVPPSVQMIGDAWVRSVRSLALRVPSVIVEGGFNYLVNPAHKDARRMTIESITRYEFDPRMRL